eukprot:1162105-Pelagomonas_calceolata.AAC.8
MARAEYQQGWPPGVIVVHMNKSRFLLPFWHTSTRKEPCGLSGTHQPGEVPCGHSGTHYQQADIQRMAQTTNSRA